MNPLLIAAALIATPNIPYIAEDKAPADLVQAIRARRGGKLLNLDRILLYSPNYAKGWNTFFGAVRGQLSLPGKLREIPIMAIGALNKADYEWIQHDPEFRKEGGTAEQLAALKNPESAAKNEKLFSEVERAAIALTIEMTRNIAVSDATMKRVRAALPDQQAVELIGTIAAYNMVSRFVVAAGVDLEGER
jgi:alkylhydroperoxidase family enzyme